MLNEAVAFPARLVACPPRARGRAHRRVRPASYIASEALKIDLHRRLALVEHPDELRELHAATEDRFGPVPEPVESLFAIQEAKLAVAAAGADYLVFRAGKATVGPVTLGGDELRALRGVIDTAVYTSARREVAVRTDGFEGARARRCYR